MWVTYSLYRGVWWNHGSVLLEGNKLDESLNERETFAGTVGIKRTKLEDKRLF